MSDHTIVIIWVVKNYYTITLISHASKVMLKILQARLQQYLSHEHLGVLGSRTVEALLGEF